MDEYFTWELKPAYLLRKGIVDSSPNRKNKATQYINFLYSPANRTKVAKLTIRSMHALDTEVANYW